MGQKFGIIGYNVGDSVERESLFPAQQQEHLEHGKFVVTKPVPSILVRGAMVAQCSGCGQEVTVVSKKGLKPIV